jgi:hypothetical protein
MAAPCARDGFEGLEAHSVRDLLQVCRHDSPAMGLGQCRPDDTASK